MQLQCIELAQAIAQAAALQRAGQFAQAKHSCQGILPARPGEPTAMHIPGLSLLRRADDVGVDQTLAASQLQLQPGSSDSSSRRDGKLRKHFPSSLLRRAQDPAAAKLFAMRRP